MKLSPLVSLLFLSLGISPALFGQPAVTNVSGAHISFVSTVYQFDKVTVGGSVKHEFVFTNTGDALLAVSKVQPGCGCTTVGTWSHEVEPGKTGVIPIQFNSNPYSVGGVTKNIMVTSNDKDRPTITLQLTGTVWTPLQITPTVAVLNTTADATSSAESTMRIFNNTDQPVTLSDLKNNNPNLFSAELKEVQPGKEFQLLIKTIPSSAPGQTQGSISIKTSSALPTINVLVIVKAAASLSWTPAQITLPPGPLGNVVTNFITVQNNSTNPVTLSEPSVSNRQMDVQLKETQPGRQFMMTLIAPQGFEIPSGEKVELTVKSSNPQIKLITVPIVQTIQPAVPKPAGQ